MHPMAQRIRALSLEERGALARGRALPTAGAEAFAEAERLVHGWEARYFSGRPALFTRRLRASGLDRRSVVALLARSSAGDEGGALASEGLPCPLAPLPCPLPALPAPDHAPGLHTAFEGAVAWAWAQVEKAAAALEGDVSGGLTADVGGLEEMFTEHLGQDLSSIAMRTLIVHLHRARIMGLPGTTSQDRFRSWAERDLSDPDALAALLDEFPALARTVAATASRTASSWAETLTRLGTDWTAVRAAFGHPAGSNRLVGMAALGDSHNGGRTVMRLQFEHGPDVIYKPRPMAVEAHFQDLLRWVADQGGPCPPRAVTVLDRGGHGWMETVVPAPCRTAGEIKSYYRRLGVLLLLLHVVDGTDMHSENLIAAGEHPVLVDLETLFQARPTVAPDATSAVVKREQAFQSVVLATLLLPATTAATGGTVDVGGMSEMAGQMAERIPAVVGLGTDAMRIVYRDLAMPGHDNVPRLGATASTAADHVEEIASGFADAYALVAAARAQLTAPDGPLHAFRGDRVRHLLRETADYALLLRSSYHPACMRDAVQRGFVFDALWLETLRRPHLERLIASEQYDLSAGDIPYFSASVDSRDLVDSQGRALVAFLATSGFDRVSARVEAMGEDDLVRQLACIRGSLGNSSVPATPAPFSGQPEREASTDELVGAAIAVGERLRQLAIVEGGQAQWTGPVPLSTSGFTYTLVGPDLYGGKAGIALFLAQLARATGRDDFRSLARAAFATAEREFRSPEVALSIGAFSGAPGLLYTAMHLAHLWDDEDVLAATLPLLDDIARRVRAEPDFDLLGGRAGCILVMLRLARQAPSSRALAVARDCGRHLLARAVPQPQGLAWADGGAGGRPLLGLSHGVAGAAWALSELADATGEMRFARAARRALAYERSQFDAALGNWPDFRDADTRPPTSMWAWCHGAPGIAVSRLSTVLPDDGEIENEVALALAGTQAHGFGGTHTLCHGDLGNADVLLLAAERSGDRRWHQEARRRAHAVLEDRRRIGAWRCNNVNLVECPSLMTGLAGIGYGLLRLADPSSVPSVLALEEPRQPTPSGVGQNGRGALLVNPEPVAEGRPPARAPKWREPTLSSGRRG